MYYGIHAEVDHRNDAPTGRYYVLMSSDPETVGDNPDPGRCFESIEDAKDHYDHPVSLIRWRETGNPHIPVIGEDE